MDKESKELEQKIRELTKAEEERRKAEEANKSRQGRQRQKPQQYRHDMAGTGLQSYLIPIWLQNPSNNQRIPNAQRYRYFGVNIKNKPAAAVQDGTVILAQYYGTYGNTVIIDHGGGISLYAHGSSINVSVGQQVKKGDTVLLIGSTGRSTDPTFILKSGKTVRLSTHLIMFQGSGKTV